MDAATIGELRRTMAQRPAFVALAPMVTFLVNNTRSDDGTPLTDGAVVDVLPPFAGG